MTATTDSAPGEAAIEASVSGQEIQYRSHKRHGYSWLLASTSVRIDGNVYPVTIKIAVGASRQLEQAPPQDRQAGLDDKVGRHEAKAGERLRCAVDTLETFFATCRAEDLSPPTRKIAEYLQKKFVADDIKPFLEDVLKTQRSEKSQRDLAERIGNTVNLSEYPETFPAARRARRIVAILGPTNSGKTHEALQRLSTAKSGLYLGPLRLLALEVFNRLNDEFGVVTSLVTGEERRLIENSRVTSSTVEMLDPSREVEVAVIDEIQMLNDHERGAAWTQAVVAANAEELWLLGSPSAEPAINALAARLNMPVEIRLRERMHPLVVGTSPLCGKPNQAIHRAQQGDAFIVFSRRDALNLRDELIALGRSVACIYGALSPEVREREAHRFASGEADVLVATDAVGQGLNLPIGRIIFTAVQKYNGVSRNDLSVVLLQQIAGRAGRFGHQEEDGIVVGLTDVEHAIVVQTMKERQAPIAENRFQIAPSLFYLSSIADITGIQELETLLGLFLKHANRGDNFFRPCVSIEQIERAQYLDGHESLSLALKFTFSLTPMSSRDPRLACIWQRWVDTAAKGEKVHLEDLDDSPDSASLAKAESAVQLLSAYRWLGYRRPDLFVDHELARLSVAPWVDAVDRQLRSRDRHGDGRAGPGALPSWYWRYKPAADWEMRLGQWS